MNYLYILLTIVFTVYGQLVIKWQVSGAGALPGDFAGKTLFLSKLLLNPWIISALLAAFLAALSWMMAMSKFDISHAYPFMSLSFILVLILGGIFFGEPVTFYKLLGLSLIIIGIVVGSQG
jgi:multidrug transporter EmrE-like cation transporter